MKRKQYELVLRQKLEFFTVEAIEFELQKRHCVVTDNRRSDICLLAHILSFESRETFDTLVFSSDDELPRDFRRIRVTF